jgi:hypothetical protein
MDKTIGFGFVFQRCGEVTFLGDRVNGLLISRYKMPFIACNT